MTALSIFMIILGLTTFVIGWGIAQNWSFSSIFWTVTMASALVFVFIRSQAYADDTAILKLRASTVRIAIGTGFIVEGSSGKKYLLTNWHVCNSGSWLGRMRGNFEGGKLVEGKIVKVSPLADLCASRVSSDLPALRLSKSLRQKQQIYTRGYPFDILSETTGQFIGQKKWEYVYPIEEVGECFKGSSKRRDGYGRITGCYIEYLDNLTNMYSRPGSSGSPVVDVYGDLVGVMSSWSSLDDLGGMVPLEKVQEFMTGL